MLKRPARIVLDVPEPIELEALRQHGKTATRPDAKHADVTFRTAKSL